MIFDLSNKPETPEQTIERLRARIAELERRELDQSWELNPDRSGGYTPPNEIRDSWGL